MSTSEKMTEEREKAIRSIAGSAGPLHPEAFKTHRALNDILNALDAERKMRKKAEALLSIKDVSLQMTGAARLRAEERVRELETKLDRSKMSQSFKRS